MTVIVPDSNFMASPSFLIIILLIIVLQLRERKIKLRKLVIMPVILSIITIPMIYIEMYSVFNAAVIFVGLLMGVLMGFLISRFMEVKIDEDGSMIMKGSIIAVLLWAAIIVVRIYGKNEISSLGLIDLNLLTAMFLIMAVGAMVSRRVFIYWKYVNFKKNSVQKHDSIR
ncbi:CcdC protein domain-containing protein [Methanobacterium sp.]|uniref:CcdC protein domain-containing protein n=1 Tax=Methanobacterium sp. TaxID=2164 RepID=UPI003C715DC4